MIGSREWMNISNGSLSFKEKIQLIQQILVPATLKYSKTFLKNTANAQHLELKSIQIPDTTIVKEVIAELDNTNHQAIINHSWRTYIWGVAIAQMKEWQFDEESFLIASLMHDIGLIEHLDQHSCKCFTFESALRSEKLCEKHQYPQDKTENISDAICLHQNGYLNENDPQFSKESVLLNQATSCDVIGTDLTLFSNTFQNEVLTQYPRLKFNEIFNQLQKAEAIRNTKSRTKLLRQLGMPMMIQMNIFKE